MSNSIVSKYIDAMPRGLMVAASGGSFTGEIRYVTLSTEIMAKISIDQARKMVVNEAKKMMALFDANQQIRPFLHDFPFTNKNLRYSLTFLDRNGDFHSDGSVTYVLVSDRGVTYSSYDPFTECFQDLHRESWEDALALMESQDVNSKIYSKNESPVKRRKK